MRRSILSKLSLEQLEANTDLEPNTIPGNSESEPVVQFVGPLGDEITKALQTAYDKDVLLGAPDQDIANTNAKPKPNDPPLPSEAPTDGAGSPTGTDDNANDVGAQVALESQANDALGAGLGAQIAPPVDDSPVDTIAYVVNENTLDTPTIIDAAQAMDQADEDKDFILIIDGTTDPENGLEGVPQERRVELVTSLESLARASNVPVFRSVKAFLDQL
jgi:hypothetical protein